MSLLTYDGEVVAKKTTGEIGSITTHDWIKESFTFKDYGKGVRLVGFESMGKLCSFEIREREIGSYIYASL